MTVEKSDAEWLARMAAGDQNAFASLVQRHQGRVFNLAYRFSRDRQDAEELAQEIFFKVWKYARTFKGRSTFSTWLYRLAVNTCLNYRQKKKDAPAPLPLRCDFPAAADDAGAEIMSHERQSLLDRALDDLPVRQKMAIVLANFDGKSYEEIALIMEISIAAVETLLFRARQNLGKIMKPLRHSGKW